MTMLATSTSTVSSMVSCASPKPTAVIVDDSATARAILKITLQMAGFEIVAEGERGDQALALYERFHPTVLTLDIVMPILDGVSAAEIVLRRYPNAVIVMCSSLNTRDKIMACHDLGVKHFILKPLVPETIAKIARGLLDAATSGVEATL